jgi:hypothetical protein
MDGPVKNHFKALGRSVALLAPLRFGAGIKGKIADSWLAGTPVVTTPIGAEGMGFRRDAMEEWGGCVAESENTFVRDAVRMMKGEASRAPCANSRAGGFIVLAIVLTPECAACRQRVLDAAQQQCAQAGRVSLLLPEERARTRRSNSACPRPARSSPPCQLYRRRALGLAPSPHRVLCPLASVAQPQPVVAQSRDLCAKQSGF